MTVFWTKMVKKNQLFAAEAAGYVIITCHLALGSPNAQADFLLCMKSNNSWLWCCFILTWNYWILLLKFHLLTSLAQVLASSNLPMMWTSGTSWSRTICLCQAKRFVHNVYWTVLLRIFCCIFKKKPKNSITLSFFFLYVYQSCLQKNLVSFLNYFLNNCYWLL